MVDIYELLRRDQNGTSDYVKEFLTNLNITFNTDNYGNIFYLDHESAPLLSAHMDTVRKEADFCIGAFLTESEDDKIFSGGILGGDDKCGVYIILRALEEGKKVNFIFSRDEEIGCLGIKALLNPKNVENKEQTDKIKNNCNYCLVLDRRSNSDIICRQNFYGTKEFEDKLIEISDAGKFGYKPERGLCSDANTIRDYISTANLSVGYYKPHSQEEYILKSDLEKAYNYTIAIIDGITEKFEPYKYTYSNGNYGSYSNYASSYYGSYYDDWDEYDYGYWSRGGWKDWEKTKAKCYFCHYDENKFDKLYELVMPDNKTIKVCEFCLEDLKEELDKTLSTIGSIKPSSKYVT